MFHAADERYAVANAVPEVVSAADGVIGANGEDGVARFLRGALGIMSASDGQKKRPPETWKARGIRVFPEKILNLWIFLGNNLRSVFSVRQAEKLGNQ
ncbi:MAG: HAD hydrolase family protein [Eubacterium sp.]